MEYNLTVNDAYVKLVHQSVTSYLERWPGGDPMEQQAYQCLKSELDKLLLETIFNSN